MRATKLKLKSLLNLSSKLIPALTLSLVTVALVGGKVSAVSQTVNGTFSYNSTADIQVAPGYYATAVGGARINPANFPIVANGSSNPLDFAVFNIEMPQICSGAVINSLDLKGVTTSTNEISGGSADDFWALNIYDASDGSIIGATSVVTNGVSGNQLVRGTGTNSGSTTIAGELEGVWNISPTTSGQYLIGLIQDSNDGSSFSTDSINLTITYDDSACQQTPISTEPDSASTLPSTPVSLNILGNDTGSNLSVTKIDGQTISPGQTITLTNGSGTVKLNTDGTITFTPADGFTGQSTFSYSISDGTNEVDTGVVMIDVTDSDTVTTSTTGGSGSSTTSTNNKTLANTGSNLTLILALSLMAVTGGLSLNRFIYFLF